MNIAMVCIPYLWPIYRITQTCNILFYVQKDSYQNAQVMKVPNRNVTKQPKCFTSFSSSEGLVQDYRTLWGFSHNRPAFYIEQCITPSLFATLMSPKALETTHSTSIALQCHFLHLYTCAGTTFLLFKIKLIYRTVLCYCLYCCFLTF